MKFYSNNYDGIGVIFIILYIKYSIWWFLTGQAFCKKRFKLQMSGKGFSELSSLSGYF